MGKEIKGNERESLAETPPWGYLDINIQNPDQAISINDKT